MKRNLRVAILIAGAGMILALASGSTATDAERGSEARFEARELATMTVVQKAASLGECHTLVAAIKSAGLVGLLSEPGHRTLFAPSDEAFSAVPAATLRAWLRDREKLAEVLAHHVVDGRLLTSEMRDGDRMTALSGLELTLARAGGDWRVADAILASPDYVCRGGVVHVIDRLILPPDEG